MSRTKTGSVFLFIVLFLALIAFGCDDTATQSEKSQLEAIQKSQNRKAYVQQNDIEFKNYDRRQKLADDPTAILWCTSAFPIPSSPLFTVPIVGKLTSGSKRPFPTEQNVNTTSSYYPELPGPDGMYGSSGEYRYGFTPSGIYADWYGMPCFCTTEPMIWQKEKTEIVMQTDPALLEAHEAAKKFLNNGDSKQAYATLEEAIKKIRSEKK